MYTMVLKLLYVDGHVEEKRVKLFSNLSEQKSAFYYFEEFYDDKGKGTCIKRDDLICFELLPSHYAK